MGFQVLLPEPQRLLVGLHLCQQASKIGGLLSSHTPMLIQIDCLLGHVLQPDL